MQSLGRITHYLQVLTKDFNIPWQVLFVHQCMYLPTFLERNTRKKYVEGKTARLSMQWPLSVILSYNLPNYQGNVCQQFLSWWLVVSLRYQGQSTIWRTTWRLVLLKLCCDVPAEDKMKPKKMLFSKIAIL